MRKSLLLIALCIFTVLSFSSCKKVKEVKIVFDDSQPLAISPDISWAVISVPYATFKAEPAFDAETTGHCRRGEILQVIGNTKKTDTSVKNKNKPLITWYYFDKGWLSSENVSIYNNLYRAKTAAERMENK